MLITVQNHEPYVPCAHCGEKATCFGAYEMGDWAFACDECCGHGCEDGVCHRVEQLDGKNERDHIAAT